MLLAVFELTVTLLVKIIEYDNRLVLVSLIHAKNGKVIVKIPEKTELQHFSSFIENVRVSLAVQR